MLARTPTPPTFADLLAALPWQPIRNCPGRYRLPQHASAELAKIFPEVSRGERFRVPTAADEIAVIQLPSGGGILSYHRADGSVVHTLNTATGLTRKLRSLGIALDTPTAADA